MVVDRMIFQNTVNGILIKETVTVTVRITKAEMGEFAVGGETATGLIGKSYDTFNEELTNYITNGYKETKNDLDNLTFTVEK